MTYLAAGGTWHKVRTLSWFGSETSWHGWAIMTFATIDVNHGTSSSQLTADALAGVATSASFATSRIELSPIWTLEIAVYFYFAALD